MKKLLSILLLIPLFYACKDRSHSFDTYFCTTTPSVEKRYLYVNSEMVGAIPYTTVAPTPENVGQGNVIYKGLRSGRHRVQVKDSRGAILFDAKLKLRRVDGSSSISSSISHAGWDTRVKVKEEVLVIDLVH